MIAGRPINLWLGVVTSSLAVLQIVLVNVVGLDPVLVATLLGAIGILVGSLISLIANAPPTVAQGGQVQIQTPAGQPNTVATLGVDAESGQVIVRQPPS